MGPQQEQTTSTPATIEESANESAGPQISGDVFSPTEQAPSTTSTDAHQCTECHGRAVYDGHDLVCQDCSLVQPAPKTFNIRINPHSEFGTKGGRGGNVRPGDSSGQLRTSMAIGADTVHGGKRSQYHRLSRIQNWTIDSTEENFRRALAEFKWVRGELDYPEHVMNRAWGIYRRFVREGHMQGRSILEFVYASTIWTFREQGVPYTTGDLASVTGYDKSDITRGILTLCEALDLDYQLPLPPEAFIPRLVSDHGYPVRLEQQARELLEPLGEEGENSGAVPKFVAGAAVYTAGILDEEAQYYGQRKSADVVGCSEKTIRQHYRKLLDANDLSQNQLDPNE